MCFEICTQFQCLSWGFPMSVVKLCNEGSWCRWPVLPGHNKTLEERSNQSVSLMLYLKLGGFAAPPCRSTHSILLLWESLWCRKNTAPPGAASPNTSSCCLSVLLLPHFSALTEPWQLWAALAMERAANKTWCEPTLPGLHWALEAAFTHSSSIQSLPAIQTGAVSPQANNEMKIQWSSHNQDQMQKRPATKALPSH